MKRVHFILDEAASLGHLEAIDDAVDKYRGLWRAGCCSCSRIWRR